jgi:inosine-uridine nucleoside N-ribohydrolase
MTNTIVIELESYPGTIHKDGVEALVNTILQHNEEDPIALVCIGPLTNIGAAIERSPEICKKVKFVGMFGSVRKAYANSNGIVNEYNVRKDVKVRST